MRYSARVSIGSTECEVSTMVEHGGDPQPSMYPSSSLLGSFTTTKQHLEEGPRQFHKSWKKRGVSAKWYCNELPAAKVCLELRVHDINLRDSIQLYSTESGNFVYTIANHSHVFFGHTQPSDTAYMPVRHAR